MEPRLSPLLICETSQRAPEVMGKIVEKFIREMEVQLRERKIEVEFSPAARAHLAEKGYDRDFGARPLARLIEKEIKDLLSDEVLFGRLTRGGRVTIDFAGDAFCLGFPERVSA